MAKVSDLKDSKFLTKEDCGDDGIAVTIAGWKEMDVSMESEPARMKYILEFQETDKAGKPIKALVLNNTNGQRIQSITGSDDFDDWIGHRITLYNDKSVMFAGERKGGIRVYVPQQAPAAARQNLPQGVTPTQTHVGNGPPPASDDDVPDNLDKEPY